MKIKRDEHGAIDHTWAYERFVRGWNGKTVLAPDNRAGVVTGYSLLVPTADGLAGATVKSPTWEGPFYRVFFPEDVLDVEGVEYWPATRLRKVRRGPESRGA